MSRLLQNFARGADNAAQREIEAIIAQSPDIVRQGHLVIPPHYTLLHVSGVSRIYDAGPLLSESQQSIDRHLYGQLCVASSQDHRPVPARLYNFLTIDGLTEVVIEPDQLVHLYEHLLLHLLGRYRRITNRPLQARTHGTVIFFDNTFQPEADAVCRAVWTCLVEALQGTPYPSIQEVRRLSGYATLQEKMGCGHTAS